MAPRKPTAPAAAATKLFVLDTNVLMHDPTSLFRFEEHDVYVPMMTLEELDNNKKGMSEIARNARQVTRTMDDLVSHCGDQIDHGIPLAEPSKGLATGRLYLQTEAINTPLPPSLPSSKYDNQILGVILFLQLKYPGRAVILVSKDINMRIKARALGLLAEDYFNDKVLEDTDLLYAGSRELPGNFWDTHGTGMESWKKDTKTGYRITGPLCRDFLLNDPEIDFVSLLGQAGTGKTLLTLAAALTQVLDQKRYAEIIMTRVTVPVGEDIGFLPGTEEEKMTPWMGALEDNLDVLNKNEDDGGPYGGEWGRAATRDLIRSRIKVKSRNFMRGRTFIQKFLIIDEAQNLTPKQMKTLITRAGPGTKVVCLGNIAQIDTPYLTEGSSGLTYVVDRMKGWPHAGHITLQRGERSRLADFASEVL